MNLWKLINFVTIIFLLSFELIYAINKSELPITSDNTRNYDKNGREIAYTITVESNQHQNSITTVAKCYDIPVLPETEYLPNTIHVKTRNYYSLNQRKNKLPRILDSDNNKLDIVEINAPYERFNNGKLKSFDRDGISRIYEITYASGKNPYEVCKELMKNPDVEYAVPVFMRYFDDYTPNDPQINKEWHLENIEAYKSWDISKGDSSIIIAIVDSGTEYIHEDLTDNIWYNYNEIPDDGIDNDSNGYVDDWRGWDFVGNISLSQAAYGQWKPDNDPKPGHFHGTHVAGCAAAVGNNAKGVAGPGYQCKIMPLKCGTDQSDSRNIFRGYDAILYAAEMGADIINNSWGGEGGSPVEQELINTAVNMGSVVVVSAGNSYKNIDYGNSYPAGYDNVLCVGATTTNDRKANFSNYGHLVTVYGPGYNIYSTMTGNRYSYQSGTSMSGPVVAGICGQLKAVHPEWTPQQIMHQIRSTSEDVVATSPELRPQYYGRVNAYRALSYNNPEVGSEKVPGISVSKILSEGVEVLTDYKSATFKIEITNYLSIARRTKVKITPLQKYLYVSTDKIDIGTMEEMSSDTFSLEVRLLESTPWFEGKVDILLEFSSDSYVDYEIIQLPLQLETDNEFSLKYIFPESYLPIWLSADSKGFNTVFLVGASLSSGNGIFYKYGSIYNPTPISTRPLYCVHMLDENTLYAGSGGSPTEIVKTTNGGNNWSSLNVSALTGFVNAIYFFDNVDGVFAGDPLNGEWGIGKTTNAGQSWSNVYNVPEPLSGEAGLAGCAHGIANLFWFGTTKGRIIMTKDRGKNWQVSTVKSNAYIHRIHFIDGLAGMVIYTNSKYDSEKKVAFSFDGGINWTTERFNFSELGVDPLTLYSPEGSSSIIALCRGGEIYSSSDFGNSWQPILTYKYSTVSFGAFHAEAGEGRVWAGETELTYLDFEYLPDNPSRLLEVSPSGPIDFEEVEAGKAETITLSLTNKGNVIIKVDSLKIIPLNDTYEEEFRITFPIADKISVDETRTTRIKFSPVKEGLREAQLVIYSNADEEIKTINLKGTGTDAVMEISFVSDTIVDFDSVEIGKYEEYNLRYRNTGNVYFNIHDIFLDTEYHEAEFTISDFEGYEISPGHISDISITFSPTAEGLQTSNLKIQSDAGETSIPVVGFGMKPISVEENNFLKFSIDNLSPNPCNNFICLILSSDEPANISFGIYNYLGQELQLHHNNITSGQNIIRLNTEKLSPGIYFIKTIVKNSLIINKFIKGTF
jgi:photosystem II stability/assembly factor-like uncharacterized protein